MKDCKESRAEKRQQELREQMRKLGAMSILPHDFYAGGRFFKVKSAIINLKSTNTYDIILLGLSDDDLHYVINHPHPIYAGAITSGIPQLLKLESHSRQDQHSVFFRYRFWEPKTEDEEFVQHVQLEAFHQFRRERRDARRSQIHG